MQFKEMVGHVVGLESQVFKTFSTAICQDLLSVIADKKTFLPSPLMIALFDKMEEIVSDNDLCDVILSHLKVSNFDIDIQSQFLSEFMLNFTTDILKFISSTYRSTFCPKQLLVPELDVEDRQVIFYIGGSIMKGYLRIAYRHKGRVEWGKAGRRGKAVSRHLFCREAPPSNGDSSN